MTRFPNKNFKIFLISPIVSEFPRLAYTSKIMIAFDWIEWNEGTKIVEDTNFNYSTLDRVGICKLLTAVVQSESYVHNGLVEYFEDGIILDLLENLEKKFKIKRKKS